MNDKSLLKPIIYGCLATGVLLGLYFFVLSVVSGWSFALGQFSQFWYFVVSLALGFGIQIGLYAHLKQVLRHQDPSGKMVAVTGTTSTAAMISCCAHYLVNILPVLGATGIATIAAQYQIQFFWLGLLLNIIGIGVIVSRIKKIKSS